MLSTINSNELLSDIRQFQQMQNIELAERRECLVDIRHTSVNKAWTKVSFDRLSQKNTI